MNCLFGISSLITVYRLDKVKRGEPVNDLGLTCKDFAKEFLKFTESYPPLYFNVIFIPYIFRFKTTNIRFVCVYSLLEFVKIDPSASFWRIHDCRWG